MELTASLCKQLAENNKEQLKLAEELYLKLRNGEIKPNPSQLSNLLLSLCQLFVPTFIIVDALDECTAVEERRQLLLVLQSLKEASVKVLVTSRPNLADINEQLHGAPTVEIVAVRSDIHRYVQEKTKKNRAFMKRVDPPMMENIVSSIADRASGL